NAQPLEIEIGFGKGAFLLDQATKHPERNYLGIEIDRGLQLYVATRVAKRALPNVRLVGTDARRYLTDCLKFESATAVHVYFPDPWWKRRHRKRRVFTAELAEQCERILFPEGKLHIATDVEEYFFIMQRTVAENTQFRKTDEVPPLDVETNF